MTTPKEALAYISNARWNENADLDDICTMADRALASLEGDAVERVARIISRAMLDNPTGDTSEERAAKRKAIATEYAAAYVADLATGLVAGEAAIRADEREKCAKVADEHSFGRDIDWWLRATKKDVSAETCRSIAAAIRSGGGQ